MQVVELVLENQQDTIWDLSIEVEWFVKTVPNTAAECVCMVGTKIHDGSS